jgi:hypothetical protein
MSHGGEVLDFPRTGICVAKNRQRTIHRGIAETNKSNQETHMQQDLPKEESQGSDIRRIQVQIPALPLPLPTAADLSATISAGYRPWLAPSVPPAAFKAAFPPQTSPSLETSSLLHDVRNMLGALQLYSDLLEEPGVLAHPYGHYAGELRLICDACRSLLERFMLIAPSEFSIPQPAGGISPALAYQAVENATELIPSLAAELEMNRNLLAAIAGPAIRVSLTRHGGNLPIAMTREDLVRVLVNLIRNAAQAMPGGGAIEIDLEESAQALTLTFSDTVPGIPEASLEVVFSPGYTTGVLPTANTDAAENSMPVPRRGLGLAIVRSLVSAAGGSVRAARRTSPSGPSDKGAMIVLEFPLPTTAPHESTAGPPASASRHPV